MFQLFRLSFIFVALFFQYFDRMFQLLGVEVTKAQLSFDTTVISRVQKVGSIVPLESRIYAVWSLNIEGGCILYNSVPTYNHNFF